MGIFASILLAMSLLGTPATAPVAPSLDNATDAWSSYDSMDLEPLETSVPMILDYVETVQGMPVNVATVHGYFTVESTTTPGTFHVMRWSVLYSA